MPKKHLDYDSLIILETLMEADSAIIGSIKMQLIRPGDTILSVIKKKTVDRIVMFLNPDTYSKQTINQLNQTILKYKTQIVSGIIVVGIPILIIYPILRPRLQKIKRQFLFQYYLQSSLLAKKLDAGTNKLPIHEVEQIIRRSQAKIKL